MKSLSIIIPIYIENEKDKNPWILDLYDYCVDVESQLEVIIINDGSPGMIDEEDYSNIRFHTIWNNKPWNQPEARNIGAILSQSELLLFTDVDHTIPLSIIKNILYNKKPKTGEIFRYKRIYNAEDIQPHINTFVINKSDFGQGYDTEFCGHYGYDDTYFFATRNLWVSIEPGTIKVNDLKSHNLERNTEYNKRLFEHKLKMYNANLSEQTM